MGDQHTIDPDRLPYAPEDQVVRETIDPATFFAVDMRVGRVTAVEPFPEARKPAWKVTADFGPQIGLRSTSAQVTNYSQAELIGRKIVGVVNLPAKRIAGFSSAFLILAGLEADGTCRLLSPDGDLPVGSLVA